MRLSKLVDCIHATVEYNGKEWEREISALSFDSRQINGDTLFFCLKGGCVDGSLFAKSAIAAGAVALVTEKKLDVCVPQLLVKDARKALAIASGVFFGNPSENVKIIGVTGTNGKTTTTYMLASVLQAAGKNVGIIGTLGVRYNGQEYASELTTPDPIFLQKTLADMFIHGVEYVVMEVSAHALYYKKTAGVRFVACIFTNLTQDHLDFFPDMRTYESVKRELFSAKNAPIAILNGDDETGRKWGKEREEQERLTTVYYGLSTPSDAFAVITDETLYGTECLLNINDNICRVSLSMTGRHNVYNALGAAACALFLGVDTGSIAKGLSLLPHVRGRLQKTASYHGAEIFVDFAHTPDGLEKSLSALKTHCKGRLVCLFGCGGNRDKSTRPIMGETVAKQCDFAVLTSDNPRYEDPLDIIGAIEKGYRRFSMKYVVVPDRERAIDYALDYIKQGDVLLVAGKGGETYQEIMGIKYHFDDQDIIAEILKNKGEERC